MSGKFAHLRPDSDERLLFWNKHVDNIHSLLEEINKDVFDGIGVFGKALLGKSTDPPLVEPYLTILFKIEYQTKFISVCTASSTQLRVYAGVGYYASKLGKNQVDYYSYECAPNFLEEVLVGYVQYLVG